MEIKKGIKETLGSCNFCKSISYYVVYEIKGEQTTIRMCSICIKKLLTFN